MFTQDQVYKRSAIHDQYGGNRQGGIASSAQHPSIFIFTGKAGQEHGYRDGWDNHEVFSYTGEGQVGDMQFIKGNLALLEHVSNRKTVYLFEQERKAYVKFIAELELFDWDNFDTHDREGNMREAIKFFFKRKGAKLDIEPADLTPIAKEQQLPYQLNIPDKTERKGLVTSRVGQGAYRKSILHRWNYKCAVTGFDNPKVLVASHIVAWKGSTDKERLDIDNGILLSPTYDALFDRHLISFEETGKIILSSTLKKHTYEKLGVTGVEQIIELNQGNQEYLERHRSIL